MQGFDFGFVKDFKKAIVKGAGEQQQCMVYTDFFAIYVLKPKQASELPRCSSVQVGRVPHQ